MIVAEGLTRLFGEVVAVSGVDLEVREGEIFGLLGPNGAGKTTTVRLLTGLIAPTRGRALIEGLDVQVEGGRVRELIGLLPEVPGLYERLSAYRNLEFFAELYGLSFADRRHQIRKYLELLGLWERRDDPVAGFSKGMRQKLALARALLHEPPYLFLDEPTTGLDPEAARSIRKLILQLSREGRTVVLCTHNLEEADALCSRIGFLRNRLLKVDSPSRLRRELYGYRLMVVLKACSQRLVEGVQDLPFVREVEVKDRYLLVSVERPEEDNPVLVRRLVELGGEVVYVREHRPSLEEIYFRVVGSRES